MERQTNYIVFLCYGNKGVFYECGYALLSLARISDPEDFRNTEVWIYTDDPDWFKPFKNALFPICFRHLDAATIKKWRGDIDFVHRVKVEMLRDFTKEQSGNILYADTDIVFTHRVGRLLQGINAGDLYMHTMEAIVQEGDSPIFRKLNSHFKKKKSSVNGKPLTELAMWNAGVIGFNTRFKHLLEEVLVFTDEEYPQFPKHIVEQFAFSVYFQHTAAVKAASPYIFHYWKLKEARIVLASFFDYFKGRSFDELVHCSMLVQIPALMQQKVDYYHNKNIASAIAKKGWAPPVQNWALLEQQI